MHISLTKKMANQEILNLMNKDNELKQKEIILFKKLMLISDLTIQNKIGLTPSMFILEKEKNNKFHMNSKQWDYLILNSNLKQQNKNKQSVLMLILMFDILSALKDRDSSFEPFMSERAMGLFRTIQ